MNMKLIRRPFSAALVLFAGFRFVQLVMVLVNDPSGSSLAEDVGAPVALALAIRGALPFHLTLVALLLQRPYVPHKWGRVAWYGTVISGSWLGIAVAIRYIFLR